jgi:hypothetical protein
MNRLAFTATMNPSGSRSRHLAKSSYEGSR